METLGECVVEAEEDEEKELDTLGLDEVLGDCEDTMETVKKDVKELELDVERVKEPEGEALAQALSVRDPEEDFDPEVQAVSLRPAEREAMKVGLPETIAVFVRLPVVAVLCVRVGLPDEHRVGEAEPEGHAELLLVRLSVGVPD